MVRFCVFAASFACALAHGTAAPVPEHLFPKREPLFFSVRPGDSFVLVHKGQEYTATIVSAEPTRDGYTVVQRGARPDGTKFEQTVLVSPAGVRTIRYDGRDYDEPHVWLRVPHVANNAWTTALNGTTYHYKTVGWEDVEVPYGKVRALRVERTPDGATVAPAVYYWAHGVGCVKWTNGGDGRELKSFTPAKREARE
jgi:hypothetical protein